jgi:hypothetical protein
MKERERSVSIEIRGEECFLVVWRVGREKVWNYEEI